MENDKKDLDNLHALQEFSQSLKIPDDANVQIDNILLMPEALKPKDKEQSSDIFVVVLRDDQNRLYYEYYEKNDKDISLMAIDNPDRDVPMLTGKYIEKPEILPFLKSKVQDEETPSLNELEDKQEKRMENFLQKEHPDENIQVTNIATLKTDQQVTPTQNLGQIVKTDAKEIAIIKTGGQFKAVGVREDGSFEELTQLKQNAAPQILHTIDRNGDIGTTSPTTNFHVEGMNKDENLSLSLTKSRPEVHYTRSDSENNQAIGMELNSMSIVPHSLEARRLMDKNRNPDINDEIGRTDASLEANSDKTHLQDVDGRTDNDSQNPGVITVTRRYTSIEDEKDEHKLSADSFWKIYNSQPQDQPVEEKFEDICDKSDVLQEIADEFGIEIDYCVDLYDRANCKSKEYENVKPEIKEQLEKDERDNSDEEDEHDDHSDGRGERRSPFDPPY